MRSPERPIITGISLPENEKLDKEKPEAETRPVTAQKKAPAERMPEVLTPAKAAAARKEIAEGGGDSETKRSLREYDKATQPYYPAAELIKALMKKNSHLKARYRTIESELNPEGKPFIALDDIPGIDLNVVLDTAGVSKADMLRRAKSEQASYYDLVAQAIEKNLGVKAVSTNEADTQQTGAEEKAPDTPTPPAREPDKSGRGGITVG